MKTKNMISAVLKTFAFVALAFGITNCNKNNSNGTYNGLVNGYRIVNGVCYQSINGVSTQANSTVCSQMAAPMYQMSNGICYQSINGQMIQQPNATLCSTTGMYGGTGYGTYQMGNDGICYQNMNGQYIPQPNTSLCYNNTGMYNNGYNNGYNTGMYGVTGTNGMAQACYGTYWSAQYGNVQCGTQYRCQGQFYNQYGQVVYCQ